MLTLCWCNEYEALYWVNKKRKSNVWKIIFKINREILHPLHKNNEYKSEKNGAK